MSALPGHDRITEDEKRAEAAAQEHDGPVSVNAPGRDLIAELIQACQPVAQPTKRDTEASPPVAPPDQG